MDFYDFASQRCSVRSYQDREIELQKLKAVLEAGRIAPSGCNLQAHRLLVVQSEEGIEKMAQAVVKPDAYTAKAFIIVCMEKESAWVRKFDEHNIYEIDASIVTTYMMLEAQSQGLNSLWVCRFKPDLLKESFNIPEAFVPVNILCLGYGNDEAIKPADRYKTERKPLEETVWFEKFE
ncbi:MAG: nitroreductase family protein [Ruminococcus sp.]|nr:nitroreductase family protein [Ruminococcus sp.]